MLVVGCILGYISCGKENWILEVRFRDLGPRCWGLIIGCRVLGFRGCTLNVECRMLNNRKKVELLI